MSGIIRVKKKESDYFMALNAPFNDEKLSFGARGILAYLLSKPDDWEVMNDDLYRKSPASRTAVDRMIKELKDNGYLRRWQEANDKGHRVWVAEVYEDRSMNPDWNNSSNDDGKDDDAYYPKAQNPTVGKPERRETRLSVRQQSENPTVGKPDDILITDSNKGLNQQITERERKTQARKTSLPQTSKTENELQAAQKRHALLKVCYGVESCNKATNRQLTKVDLAYEELERLYSPDTEDILGFSTYWWGDGSPNPVQVVDEWLRYQTAKTKPKAKPDTQHATRATRYRYFDEQPEYAS